MKLSEHPYKTLHLPMQPRTTLRGHSTSFGSWTASWAQEISRKSQDGPMAEDGPMMATRWPQDGPKMGHEAVLEVPFDR